MSIEKAIKRNNEKHISEGRNREFALRLLPSNEKQKELTAEWILPYEEQILQDVKAIRKRVDRELRKEPDTRARLKQFNKEYPLGLCSEIRNQVLSDMQAGMMDKNNQGLKSLHGFIREGGIVQKFWGIDHEKYFQNAIQLGDAILDVANDTVDASKEPVVFYPSQAEAPIRRIEHFTEFADVAQEYWDVEVYPNIYLPHFAPVFPILTFHKAKPGVSSEDNLYIESDVVDLYFSNIRTRKDEHLFGLSSDFLFNSPYSEKRLPDEMLEALFENPMLKRFQRMRPDLFRVSTNPKDSAEELSCYHFNPDTTDEVWRQHLNNSTLLVMQQQQFHRRPIATIKR